MTTPATGTAPSRHDHSERIAAALARLNVAVAGRPGFGRSAHTSVSELAGGVRCSSTEGRFTIESDLAPGLGGEGTAPSPMTLVRAALGACLAMGYRLRAAELGVELTSVRVTVDAEAELRGMLTAGGDAPPGFTSLRYHVEIDSPAPYSEIQRVVDLGDRLSPVLDALASPHEIGRTVSINPAV